MPQTAAHKTARHCIPPVLALMANMCGKIDGIHAAGSCWQLPEAAIHNKEAHACLNMVVHVQGGAGGKFAPMAQKEKPPPAAADDSDDSGSSGSGSGSAGLVSSG